MDILETQAERAESCGENSSCFMGNCRGPRTPARNWAAQQEVSGRHVSEASYTAPHQFHYGLHLSPSLFNYHLNHFTPLSVKKLSSMKPVTGVKKIGD